MKTPEPGERGMGIPPTLSEEGEDMYPESEMSDVPIMLTDDKRDVEDDDSGWDTDLELESKSSSLNFSNLVSKPETSTNAYLNYTQWEQNSILSMPTVGIECRQNSSV